MRRLGIPIASLASLLLPMFVAAQDAGSAPCWSFRSSTPYRGFGYDHVVTVDNRCRLPLTCQVSTDVNPAAQRLRVAAESAADLLTYRGSPAQVFKAKVECRQTAD